MATKIGKSPNVAPRQLQQRQQYRVLDEAARNRRNRNQLEQLERDNFHDDPHANLVMHKKAPKFEDNSKSTTGSSTSSSKRHALPRSRLLSFPALLEEDIKLPTPNYSSVVAPNPKKLSENKHKITKIPQRRFCCVCGFKAAYTCITCGVRYCSIHCFGIHRDTRCLKWTS